MLGLSKLARATRCLSGKIQHIEHLAADLMSAIEQEITPKGVFVSAEATLLGQGDGPAAIQTAAVCGCFAGGDGDGDEGSGLLREEVQLLLSRGKVDSCSGGGGEPRNSSCGGRGGEKIILEEEEADSDASLRMVTAVESLLRGVGEDPFKNENLKGSAARYVRWLQSATAGYSMPLPPSIVPSPQPLLLQCLDDDPITLLDAVSSDTSSEDMSNGGAGGGAGACFVNLREERRKRRSDSEEPGGSNGDDNDDDGTIINNGDSNKLAVHQTNSEEAVVNGSGFPVLSASERNGGNTSSSDSSTIAVLSVKFSSQCEHHLLPFYGTVKIGYSRPSAAVSAAASAVSASGECSTTQHDVEEALTRVIEVFSRRLQVQERLTQQIADAAAAVVVGSGNGVDDVMVLCESAHMCMVARGVEEHASSTITTAVRGGWAEDAVERGKALRRILTVAP